MIDARTRAKQTTDPDRLDIQDFDGNVRDPFLYNEQVTAWAQARADELAQKNDMTHTGTYNGAPGWAVGTMSNSPNYTWFPDPSRPNALRGAIQFGPENLATCTTAPGAEWNDFCNPIRDWYSELQTSDHGYGHYLAEVSRLANVAGIGVAKSEQGNWYTVLEIAYLAPEKQSDFATYGTTQDVREALKALEGSSESQPEPQVDQVETPTVAPVDAGTTEDALKALLPATVKVTWTEGKEPTDETVVWRALTQQQKDALANGGTSFTLTGDVTEYNKTVDVTITVKAKPATKQITSVLATAPVQVNAGTSEGALRNALPEKVAVSYGSLNDTGYASVTWEDLTEQQRETLAGPHAGHFEVQGDVEGTDLPATMTVEVTQAGIRNIAFEGDGADGTRVQLSTPVNTDPTPRLPQTIKVTWEGSFAPTDEAITWDPIPAERYSKPAGETTPYAGSGPFRVSGQLKDVTMSGKPIRVYADVTVSPARPTGLVKNDFLIPTEPRVWPELPKEATVNWSDSATTTAPIEWDSGSLEIAEQMIADGESAAKVSGQVTVQPLSGPTQPRLLRRMFRVPMALSVDNEGPAMATTYHVTAHIVAARPITGQGELKADLLIADTTANNFDPQTDEVRKVGRGEGYTYDLQGKFNTEDIKTKIKLLCSENRDPEFCRNVILTRVNSQFVATLVAPAGVQVPTDLTPADLDFNSNDLFEVSSVKVEGQVVTVTMDLKNPERFTTLRDLEDSVSAENDWLEVSVKGLNVSESAQANTDLKFTGTVRGTFTASGQFGENPFIVTYDWQGVQDPEGLDSTLKGSDVEAQKAITLTVNPAARDIAVKKIWLFEGDLGKPAVTFNLWADRAKTGKTLTLTGEPWEGNFKDVNTYKPDGKTKIAYSIDEVKIEGWDSAVSGSADGGFEVTNSFVTPPEPVNLKAGSEGDLLIGLNGLEPRTFDSQHSAVRKLGAGANYVYAIQGTFSTADLKAQAQELKAAACPEEQTCDEKISDLEAKDFRLTVQLPEGLTTSDAPVVTLGGTAFTAERDTKVTDSYTWNITFANAAGIATIDDLVSAIDSLGEEITVLVPGVHVADGAKENENLTARATFGGTIAGKAGSTGNEVDFSIALTATQSEAGLDSTLVASADPEAKKAITLTTTYATRTIKVTKKWEMGDAKCKAGTDEVTAEADAAKCEATQDVTVRLFNGPIGTGKVLTLTKAGGYTGTITSVNAVTPEGKPNDADYSVQEDALDGYAVTYSGNPQDGFVVTNTLTAEPVDPGTPDPEEPGDDGTPGTPGPEGTPETGGTPAPSGSPSKPAAPVPGLAKTGAQVAGALLGGTLLVGAGALLLALRRRQS